MNNRPFTTVRLTIGNPETGKQIRTKPMKVFLDTGASVTIIPVEALAAIDPIIGPFKASGGRVRTANGIKKVLTLENVKFCIDECCIQGNILVTDQVPGTALIGSDFMKKTKTKVDFGKRLFICNGSKKKMTLEG